MMSEPCKPRPPVPGATGPSARLSAGRALREMDEAALPAVHAGDTGARRGRLHRLCGLLCWRFTQRWHTFDAANKAVFNPLDTNFNVLVIGVLFFGVLGALVVTNEYGNGLIRVTLAATPQRGLILAAKTALLVLIALLSSAVICFAAFLTGQGILAGHVPHVTLADPGVLGAASSGAICYLTAASLIGLFIGVITRSAAVAMTCVFGVFLVLPTLLNSLHGGVWRHTVPYLPSNLGNALWLSHTGWLARPTVAAIGLAACSSSSSAR